MIDKCGKASENSQNILSKFCVILVNSVIVAAAIYDFKYGANARSKNGSAKHQLIIFIPFL